MNKLFYVITLRGVPIDVTEHHSRALKSKAENSGVHGEAQIIPVIPIATESLGLEEVENPGTWEQLDLPLDSLSEDALDFLSEEDTIQDMDFSELNFDE